MTDDSLKKAIEKGIAFLEGRNYHVPPDLLQVKENKTEKNLLEIAEYIKSRKQIGYSAIRDRMWASIYDNVYGYLDSNRPVTVFSSNISTSVSQAFVEASEAAWIDGGGSLPIDEDTISYGRAQISSQLSFIDVMFESLKQLRREGDVDKIHEAFRRADGYARSLDSFYNYIKISAAGGMMLTFSGSDGKESCKDCKNLKGKRHRASWWRSHDLVPPSRNFECGGYNCQHYLATDNGDIFTV